MDSHKEWLASVNGTESCCSCFGKIRCLHFLHVKRAYPGGYGRSSLAVLLLQGATLGIPAFDWHAGSSRPNRCRRIPGSPVANTASR